MRKALVLVVFAAALWLAPGALAAGWCGGGDETATDRPDVVTAQQVHAVVAIPSDAADPFATDAGRIADDVTSMLTWWQGQDPTRVPRFDQATFGGTNCLDITLLAASEHRRRVRGRGCERDVLDDRPGAVGDGQPATRTTSSTTTVPRSRPTSAASAAPRRSTPAPGSRSC